MWLGSNRSYSRKSFGLHSGRCTDRTKHLLAAYVCSHFFRGKGNRKTILNRVISGTGEVRHAEGTTPIETGDAFLFKPGEPHQLINTSDRDMVIYVIADNPIGESVYYHDSKKWAIRSPERRVLRGEPLDYFDGEE